jgi:hypothetical protein
LWWWREAEETACNERIFITERQRLMGLNGSVAASKRPRPRKEIIRAVVSGRPGLHVPEFVARKVDLPKREAFLKGRDVDDPETAVEEHFGADVLEAYSDLHPIQVWNLMLDQTWARVLDGHVFIDPKMPSGKYRLHQEQDGNVYAVDLRITDAEYRRYFAV